MYFSVNVKSLTQDEKITALHKINSRVNAVPEIAITTSSGRLIMLHAYVDEETLSLEESVIEAPKKFYSSLTSFFTGGIIDETNFHRIQSDLKDKSTLLLCFGMKSVSVWTQISNAPNLWRINVEQIFRSNNHEAGDIVEFKIIGEEVTAGEDKDSRSLTLIVQTTSRTNEKEKSYYTLHFIMKLDIDLQKQTYDFKNSELLTDAKLYSKEDEDVKCLVCSNDCKMTYVFLINSQSAK